MKPYEIRTTAMVVAPEGEPLFSELATRVTIVDDAAGEFVEVAQDGRDGSDYSGKIGINPEEWPMLREAIDMAVANCRPTESKGESDEGT